MSTGRFTILRQPRLNIAVISALTAICMPNRAVAKPDELLAPATVLGVKIRVGGRYDDIRMCVASPAGSKGGLAADISLFAEFAASNNLRVHVDLPVLRPILFAAAFKMLQFEPSVTLKFRTSSSGGARFVGGPTLGLSLHYGPDFNSSPSGDGRTPSFFAIGPTVGGYLGLELGRPNHSFNFELGLTPFFTPMFATPDATVRRGIVAGGLLDGAFRFALSR